MIGAVVRVAMSFNSVSQRDNVNFIVHLMGPTTI